MALGVSGAPGSVATLVVEFLAAAAVALAASAVLAGRLERVGARLGLTESILGLVAALAANGPEIASAVTAMVRGQRQVGATVVLGSNVFNLAALLGVGALVAGRIRLHRGAVELAGAVALWMAAVALGTVGSGLPAAVALALALVVFVPYVIASGWRALLSRLAPRLPAARWLARAVVEEEIELLEAIHPRPGGGRDAGLAAGALVVVVGASIVMEHSATALGTSVGLSPLVVGAVLLAAVTSLPNAVAAVYLATRGRGAAVLSEALNSNNLNILLGLLVPGAIFGLGGGGGAVLTAAFAAGLSVVVLVVAHRSGGLERSHGVLVVAGYGLFLVALLAFVAG